MLCEQDEHFDPLRVKCMAETWGEDFFPNYQRVCLCTKCAQDRMWKRMAEEDEARAAASQSPPEPSA